MKSHKLAATPPAATSPRASPKNRPGKALRLRPTEGKATFVAGSSGCGKTTWVIGEVRPAPRILAWDSGYDFAPALQLVPIRSLQELGRLVVLQVRSPDQVPARIAYTGPITRDHFITFCRLAFVWMRSHEGSVLLVDELSDVTSPGKATAGWGEIVRKHRKFRRGHVYAITQRPAESDKTIVGNATVLHSGRFNFDSDEEYMARCLKVPLEELQGLPEFHYIERNMRTKVTSRGVVRL